MMDMLLATVTLFFVLVYQTHGFNSSKCYLDAHEGKLSGADEGRDCTPSEEFTAGCKDFRGEYTPFDWDTDEEKFAITAVEWRTDPVNRLVKTTVLSVTISNFSFHKLDFRLVDRTDPPIEGEYCQRITFDKDKLPRQITLHIMAWYRRRTQIQFVGHGNERTFFREFHFLAPSHYALSNTEKIEDNRIFAYIDTTYYQKARLYVESLPKEFNVERYIVQWRQKIGKTEFVALDEFELTEESLDQVVSVDTSGASYDFLITPVVNGKNCSATATAGFNMWKTPVAIFLLIFFSVAIPVALFFILRHVYIWHRNKVWRNVKLNLLMIHNSRQKSHENVVEQLALYLKNCNINVMLDVWDIDKRPDRNPERFCDESFAKAEIVVVVSSPPETCYTETYRPIHASTQEHAINLIVANYPRRDKRYVAVWLPYCESTDLPPDARKFKHFVVPEQSKELVNYCHKTDYTDMFDKWKNNKELIGSIESARLAIQNGQTISESNDDTELSEVVYSGGDAREDDSDSDESDESSVDDPVNQEFSTQLKELNLTRGKSESESENESDDENETLRRMTSPGCDVLVA